MFGLLNQKEATELKTKIQQLETNLTITQSKLEASEQEKHYAQERISIFVDTRDGYRKDFREQASKIAELETKNAALAAENKVLHSVNTNVQKTVEDNVELRAANKFLEETIKDIKAQLKASEAREEEARKREAKAVDQVFTLKREVVQTAVVSPTVIQPTVLPTSGE